MEPELERKLSSLSEISKAQLLQIFDLCPSRKNLILQPEIIKPLERICGIKWLR